MPPAAPFLVPARKGGKNQPGRGKIPNLSPPALDLNKGCQFHGIAAQLAIKLSQPTGLLCPSFKRPKGVIPLLENPEIPPALAIRTKRDPGVRITHRICKL